MNKIFIISPKNEISGSCVSVKKLKKILHDNKFNVSIISCPGNFFENSKNIFYNTEFNILKILKNLIKVLYLLKKEKDYFILFNSILSFPYLLFFFKTKNKAILIHELNLNPKWLYNLIIFTINLFNFKVFVVNPVMLKIYKNSFLLQNYFEDFNTKTKIKKKNQIIKIANCFLKKGIKDYIDVAKKNPDIQFILLTQKESAQKECLLLLKNIPNNLIVEFDQSKKSELISTSKFLISLSQATETFGLVLIEAISYGTLPISVENPGSIYCLNNDKKLIYKRNYLIKNLKKIIKELSKDYDNILCNVEKYVKKEFSPKKTLNAFIRILNNNA